MNNLLKLVLGVSLLFSFSQLAFSESEIVDVKSLRDGYSIVNLSEEADWKKVPTDFQKFKQAYEKQPPLINHFIEGFTITAQLNDCLDCHEAGLRNAVSHFTDGNGDFLSKISNRYYFCTQCHVSQVAEEPLRNNTFENGSE